jgi:hypothetical protein
MNTRCLEGCGKFVDLKCCEKFVEGLKAEVRSCTFVQDLVHRSSARANVVCQSCLKLAIREYHRTSRSDSPTKAERQSSTAKRARVDSHGGASGVFDMYSVHMQQRTPVHTWNVCTDVPCSGEGETRCELCPCVNALYPHKTEVRRVMWLQDADEVAEGVFARDDIEAGTFLLDFGELRLATAIQSSSQWCGWRLRFDIESMVRTFLKVHTRPRMVRTFLKVHTRPRLAYALRCRGY